MLMSMTMFLAGTVAFWVIVVLSFIVMTYLLDFDNDDETHGTLITITFIVTVVLLGFVNKGPVNTFIHNLHFSGLIVIIMFYIAIGIVWSFVKWYLFLLKRRDELIEREEKSKQFRGIDGSSKVSSVPARSAMIKREDIPLAKDNKSRIVLWISYWPWSAFWTLLNDPIRKFFNLIYVKISKLYQKISDSVFRDITT